jgi:hypothetical protein
MLRTLDTGCDDPDLSWQKDRFVRAGAFAAR